MNLTQRIQANCKHEYLVAAGDKIFRCTNCKVEIVVVAKRRYFIAKDMTNA